MMALIVFVTVVVPTGNVLPLALLLTRFLTPQLSVALTKNGAGAMSVNNLRTGGIAINAGTVAVALNGSTGGASRIGTVTFAGGAASPTSSFDLADNDLILTSGLGGGYPPDQIIGQVVTLRSLEFELFQKATVQPAVDFSRLDIILVITNFRPVYITPLEPEPAP